MKKIFLFATYVLLITSAFAQSKLTDTRKLIVRDVIQFGGVSRTTWPVSLPGTAINIVDAGAIGNGVFDNATILQTIANNALSTNLHTIEIPNGTFKSTKGINFQKPGNAFFSLNIIGTSRNLNGTPGSKLLFSTKNTFGLNIQCGKGVRISNLEIQGSFTPPSIADPYTFYNLTPGQFVADGSANTLTAPYTGILIDGFNKIGYPAVEYEGFHSGYNQGGVSQAGSTSVIIENSYIHGFVNCIATSVNGSTLNAENIIIRDVWVGDCYNGIAGTQAQEKMNLIQNVVCWGTTYRLFSLGEYGSQEGGGNWAIQNCNIAGMNVEFIHVSNGNYFPVSVTGCPYLENLGRIGTFSGTNCIMRDVVFSFAYPNEAGMQQLLTDGSGAIFDNVQFKYYGQTGIMVFGGAAGTFKNCTFSGAPFFTYNNVNRPKFKGCFQREDDLDWQKGMALNINRAEDNYTTSNLAQVPVYSNTLEIMSEIGNRGMPTIFYQRASNITTPTIASHAFTFAPTYTSDFEVGGVVQLVQGVITGYGQVTAISGGNVTISYISANISTGVSTTCVPIYPNVWVGSFVGDFTAPDKISNVRLDWGQSLASFVGTIWYDPAYQNGTPFKIIAFNGTNEFTIQTTGATPVVNASNKYFSNGVKKTVHVFSDVVPASNGSPTYLPKNSYYIIHPNTNSERRFKTTASGYSALFTGETRLAVTVEE